MPTVAQLAFRVSLISFSNLFPALQKKHSNLPLFAHYSSAQAQHLPKLAPLDLLVWTDDLRALQSTGDPALRTSSRVLFAQSCTSRTKIEEMQVDLSQHHCWQCAFGGAIWSESNVQAKQKFVWLAQTCPFEELFIFVLIHLRFVGSGEVRVAILPTRH